MLFGSRAKEIDDVSAQLSAATTRIENTSAELVKTLDEMLEATAKANRRTDWRNEHPKKPRH